MVTAGIVKFLRSQVGPASKEIKTVEEYNTFIGKDDTGVVAFLAVSVWTDFYYDTFICF